MTRNFLKSIYIESYGRIFQRSIGPFAPGLNVVYGPNESGKTTTATFIGGVLFGWIDARGTRNTYKPANAQRSGMLVFAPRDDPDGAEHRLSRARNADGITPDAAPVELDDIDKATFETIFSLTSDELLGLDRAADITSHLLTAGAGTAVGPAAALGRVKDRIDACFSKAAANTESVPNLQAQLDAVDARIVEAGDEAERFKRQDREYGRIVQRRADMNERLIRTNRTVEELKIHVGTFATLQDERSDLQRRARELADERRLLVATAPEPAQAPAHDDVESLREGIDEQRRRCDRAQAALENAEDALRDARADAAALERQVDEPRHPMPTVIAVAAIVVATLTCIAALVALRADTVVAIAIAAAVAVLDISVVVALIVTATRRSAAVPVAADPAREVERRQLRVEACRDAVSTARVEAANWLDENGLSAAQGSLRRADGILDEAREFRSNARVHAEQLKSLEARAANLREATAANREQLAAVCEALDVDPDTATAAELDEHVARAESERGKVQDDVAKLEARFGELGEVLSHATKSHTFDDLKIEREQLRTRMQDTLAEFARLSLARRLLSDAIATWERKSQPQVYVEAGHFLSTMTDGAWTQVVMDDDGAIEVVDAVGIPRAATLLSLGTCQQLYLALRLALLKTASDVGRSLPVICDDILVNFDAERRRGAALALAELAETRQVIVFTCHREIVEVMQDACAEIKRVSLL